MEGKQEFIFYHIVEGLDILPPSGVANDAFVDTVEYGMRIGDLRMPQGGLPVGDEWIYRIFDDLRRGWRRESWGIRTNMRQGKVCCDGERRI